MKSNLAARTERIEADIKALAALTDPERPWTRRAFTPTFLHGRAWVESAMRRAGLVTRIDAGGNLIGRLAGRKSGLGAIMVGSHSDTVPDGGRFDGIAGVVTGLEIARILHETGTILDHDFEVIDCLAEEVSIFGVSCIGSRIAAGLLPADWLERQAEGMTLRDGIAAVGGDPDNLAAATRSDIRAFLELHIEQGPVLEDGNLDIGIVTAISGITRIEILIEGRADHAGTTPMFNRADALVAASGIILLVETIAQKLAASCKGHFAATVGEFRIEPNAANVVPSTARLLVDARSEFRQDMLGFIGQLEESAGKAAAEKGSKVASFKVISDNPPVPSDPLLLNDIELAAKGLDVAFCRMASGAGHDMAWFARVAPAAMIFIPCRGGRSHTPEEWADSSTVAAGTEVLLQTVLKIDRADQPVKETGENN